MEGWSVPNELADEDVALRAWRPSDAGWLYEAFSDAEVRSQTEQADGLSVDSVDTALAMIAEAGRSACRAEGVGLAICRQVDGEPVGSLELNRVSSGRDREAEIECLVLADQRRHGYAIAAVKLATAWALGTLGLDRLWAEVDAATHGVTFIGARSWLPRACGRRVAAQHAGAPYQLGVLRRAQRPPHSVAAPRVGLHGPSRTHATAESASAPEARTRLSLRTNTSSAGTRRGARRPLLL